MEITPEDVEQYRRHAHHAQRLRIAMGHALNDYVAREFPQDNDPRETLMISTMAFAELVAALLATVGEEAKNKTFMRLFDGLVTEALKRATATPDVTH